MHSLTELALRRAAFAALLLATLASASADQAQGRLEALDTPLGAETVQFALSRWQGRPAVSAFTHKDVPEADPVLALHVLTLRGADWRSVAHWPLPPKTRWMEPLRLPGAEGAWLLLVDAQWQVAVAREGTLERRPLCRCDTIFSHGGGPDASDHRFVHDVDGDGSDEVLLPYSGHVEAYRITPRMLAPEPLWRAAWHGDGTPLARASPAERGFVLPEFTVADVNGDGEAELLIVARDELRIARLPPAYEGGGYGLDASRRALLLRREGERALPPTLLEAVRRLGDQRFNSPDAFLEALALPATADQQAEWAPHLLHVLALARSSVLQVRPYRAPLEGVGEFREQDRALLLGRTDMDGDGVLDVLHAKLLDYRSALSQKNELRWYRGRMVEGRLAFAPPSGALRTDAGSFAELFRPRTDDAPPLALLMATTEVNLGSVMRALASGRVTLRASILPWRAGALASQPLSAAELTYHDLRASGRRAMFLFADLNGDGWRDFVLNPAPDALDVYLSAGAPPSLQAPSFTAPALALPSHPERVLVADLDGDGREELVLRYRGTYHGPLGEQLRVLRWVER